MGGAGTAKTSIINLFLSRFNPKDASSKTITFSYLTTPQIFQMSVEVSGPQPVLSLYFKANVLDDSSALGRPATLQTQHCISLERELQQ